LTNTDLSNSEFPFMQSRRLQIDGVDVIALRVSFTGDLGWELHCDVERQCELYEALLRAGRELQAGPVGSRALMSLRIEKGYGSWGREYSPEYWPHEVGLGALIKPDKGDFLNREAWQSVAKLQPRYQLAMLDVQAKEADATGGEPVFLSDGTPVGQISSGAYGYSVGQSLALAHLTHGAARAGDSVNVSILGRPHAATILHHPPFDPQGVRLRS
jgi:dimethylglycine dehydrogenase